MAIKEQTVTTVDSNSGEILSEVKQITSTGKKISEPPYAKMYFDDITAISNLEPGAARVIQQIVSVMNYDNQVILAGTERDNLCSKLNMSKSSFGRYVTMLSKANILLFKARGIYQVNPLYFGRGTWSHIKELRLSITYSENGKTVNFEKL